MRKCLQNCFSVSQNTKLHMLISIVNRNIEKAKKLESKTIYIEL